MRASEIRATGEITGSVLAGGVGLVRDVHLSIADRVFGAVGPRAATWRRAHDGGSRAVYGAMREVHRWAPRVAATVGALNVSSDATTLHASKRGNAALGAINGLWGDRLVADRNELGLATTVRHDRSDIRIDPIQLRRVYPGATGRIAVFVHGLCETEDAWFPSASRQRKVGALNFGHRLGDLGFTPVYVRYNSGLHIADNGARLSTLLDDLVATWPVPVDEVDLVGHSMGGLVARSACHHGDRGGARWVERTRRVFGLGTPHLGAPLERGVNIVAWSLRNVPETRGLAGALNTRSAGVKDLRFGSLLEDDWTDVDVDGLLTGRAAEVPFVAHVDDYFVGATVTKRRSHPVGVLAGDLLVPFGSAAGHGRRRRLPFESDNGHHIGGLNHFDLLCHPAVYAQLERWLTTSAPAATLA